jgi:methylmalonyl-CoA mutase N-terminal domain/subunit
MVEAIKTGYIQKEIQESAYRKQKEIDEEKKIVVGINKYRWGNQGEEMELLKVDPKLEKAQKERLEKLKRKREQKFVKKTLNEVKNAAESGENLMPSIIKAERAKATLNEISDQLRKIFGEYKNRNI